MLKRSVLLAIAVFLIGALAAAAEPAAAYWAGATASTTKANAETISDVVDVQRRNWRRGYWRGGIWVAPPYAYGYSRPYAARRCGWVWSPRRFRNVWRCW